MKGKKIALWVSSKAFNCSIVLIELRKEKIRVDCIVLNCWITRDKHKEHHQQQQRLMEMASCNNCSLKEKEQVYTAARDGNLMYLKVSFAGWPSWRSRHCTNHKPASIRWISIEPWIHFSSRFCRFVYFDSIFFLPSNDLTFFFGNASIDLGLAGRRSLRCPTMWIHPHASSSHPRKTIDKW